MGASHPSTLITAMNIHSAGVRVGDQRRTRQGSPGRVVGIQPNAYKLPSGAGLSFFFLHLHFCSASVTGDLVTPLHRGTELLLFVCLSVGLCVIFVPFSLSPYPRVSVAGKFMLHKLLAGAPGLGAGKGQGEPCE